MIITNPKIIVGSVVNNAKKTCVKIALIALLAAIVVVKDAAITALKNAGVAMINFAKTVLKNAIFVNQVHNAKIIVMRNLVTSMLSAMAMTVKNKLATILKTIFVEMEPQSS